MISIQLRTIRATRRLVRWSLIALGTKPLWLLLTWYCRAADYKRRRIAKCTFWGSEEFLNIASEAMRKLELMDQNVSALLLDRKFFFIRPRKARRMQARGLLELVRPSWTTTVPMGCSVG